jgi:tetratricopeptide (TPR) repeat protein
VSAVVLPRAALTDASNADPDGSEAERVAREIARTATWLPRAASLVPRSANAKAGDVLRAAQEFQRNARDAYEVQQFARAQRLTQAAREYADRAIRLAGPATDDPEYVKSVLHRTDDALDRLNDYLDVGGTVAAKHRYDELTEEQRRARRLLDEGNARGAYKATTRVRDGVLDVLRAAPPGDVPCASAKRAVANAEEARKKARKDIGTSPNAAAARHLAAADQNLARARALLDRRSCRDAVVRAKAAERQLEKAIDASRPARKG